MAKPKKHQATKKKRTRSPNYPLVSLTAGVEHAQALFDRDRRHPVPILIAHERWDFKRGSGAGNQCAAALRSYGLIQIEGKGDNRKLSVTEEGERIVRSAPNRAKLLRAAAMMPPIHAELWEKYRDAGLPSDEVIKNYLIWERADGRFNEDVVDGVIRRFRETIAFAGLDSSSIIEEDNGDESGGQYPDQHAVQTVGGEPLRSETQGSREGMMQPGTTQAVPLPVLETDGTIRIVNIPHLSEQAFDFLKNLLDQYKSAIVRNQSDEQPNE